MIQKKYINYKDYLRTENHLKTLKQKGFKIIPNKSKFKLFCGAGCLVIAIIPNGTGVIFYPASFILLGITLKDIQKFKDNLMFKIWLRFSK